MKKLPKLEGGPRRGSGAEMMEHVQHHLDNGSGSTGGDILRGIASGVRDKFSPENITKNILGGGSLAASFSKRLFMKNKKGSSPTLVPDSPDTPDAPGDGRIINTEPTNTPSKSVKPTVRKKSNNDNGDILEELKSETGILKDILEQATNTNNILAKDKRDSLEDKYENTFLPSRKSKKGTPVKGKEGEKETGGLFSSIFGSLLNLGSLFGNFGGIISTLLPLLSGLAPVLAGVVAFAAGLKAGEMLKEIIDSVLQKMTGNNDQTVGGYLYNKTHSSEEQDRNNAMNNTLAAQKKPQMVDSAGSIKMAGMEESPDANKTNVATGKIKKNESNSPIITPKSLAIPTPSWGDDADSRFTVGDIPGRDIVAAAKSAQIPPERLAAIVEKESKGDVQVVDGDTGHKQGPSVGITQMSKGALDDVNRIYKTDFSQDDVKKDYRKALLAGAFYSKIREKNNERDSIAAYNGTGPRAYAYADDIMERTKKYTGESKLQLADSAPSMSPPQAPTRGDNIDLLSTENKLSTNAVSAPAQNLLNAPSTVVNNNTTTNMPQPAVRNDESSFVRTRDKVFS